MPDIQSAPSGDELQLLEISRGSQDAFEALVRSWTPRLFSFCRAILRDTQQAEESVQDVFLRIWQKAALYDPNKGRAASWMFALAHRICIDRLRKNKTKGADLASPSGETATLPQATTPAGDPLLKIQIERALTALSPAQREVLQLAYFEGLTGAEIAQELNQPLGTIKTRLRDALLRLRRQFKDSGLGGQSTGEKNSLSCEKEGSS